MAKCTHCLDGLMERVEHHHEQLDVCGSCGITGEAVDNLVDTYTDYNVFNVANVFRKRSATITTFSTMNKKPKLTLRQRRLRLLLLSSLSHFTSSSTSSLRQSVLQLMTLAPVTKCCLEATVAAVLIVALRNNGVSVTLSGVAEVVRADQVEVGKVLRRLQALLQTRNGSNSNDDMTAARTRSTFDSNQVVRSGLLGRDKNVLFKDGHGIVSSKDVILDKVATIIDLLRLQASSSTFCSEINDNAVMAVAFLVFKAENLTKRRAMRVAEFLKDCNIDQNYLSVRVDKIEKESKNALNGLRKMLHLLPFFTASSKITTTVILSHLRDIIEFKEAIKADLHFPKFNTSSFLSSKNDPLEKTENSNESKNEEEKDDDADLIDESEIETYLRTEAQIEALRPLYEARFAEETKTVKKQKKS